MSDTSDGNINPLKPVSNAGDTSRKPVKSTAVVKYSAVQSPATFAQLQCNTNLNHPPSNWLSSSAESYGLQSVWSQNSGFSSFRMAHMFPDCVGEVDVVSDAENIKKLLKMPYSQGVVSMMVHRIENTLLLDDFDIHKYLLRQAQTDWEWLKEFFYQHIFHDSNDKDKRLFHKGNSRNSLQQKNLNSKFLYHSLVLADDNDSHDEDKPSLPLNTLDPSLPEPTNEEKLPDPNHNHKFARNVVWTFETIQMLIGTDMPIFGGKTHPCISLRLRDVNKPINVLTGIDYWLDNLMCNVPEVVMCYHLDGIVQKYELIKTEDLPNLEDAKFSPKVIRDVAQNILSFLKSNATKAGHTYWLFKGKDDDVVKLYDLTSLCTDMSDEKGQNPFTVPVAMLLYRVARNMKYSSDNRGHQGTIRMLLKNCVQLLNREKYPQIVTSAHYMLSDLYIPADTDPAAPLLVDEGEDEDSPSESGMSQPENCEGPAENDGEASATIKSLTLAHIKDESETENTKYKPLPVSGTLVERCRAALDHVSDGLDCLEYFPTVDQCDEDEKKSKDDASSSMAEENLNTAKSFEAIPMPYSPLNTEQKSENIVEDTCSSPNQKKKLKKKLKKERARKDSVNKELVDTSPRALLCKSKVDTLPTWQAPRKSDNSSWKSHLKTLLYEKASLVLSVLAEYEYTNQRYGACLRHILAVLGCQKILEVFCGQKNDKLISCLLGRAGDSCLMVVQDWKNIEIHRDCYQVKDAIEEKLVSEIFKQNDLDMNGAELIPEALDSLETTLVASYKCYEKALELEPQNGGKNNLLPRLGNIHNELGVLYMNQAASKYQQNDAEESSDATNLLTKSLTHLMAGVKAFESVRDEANLALLHSNTGRLMRLCAHMHVKKQTQERHFYNKAVASYQKALQVLGNRKTNTSIWDTVTWELSTTLFTMATLLQDYPTSGNKTEEELERDVVDLLQKSLKYCDTETPGPRQPVYQFRVATIQHRLASLYHRVYRELESDSECIRRKTSLQLSKMYYDKAAKLFMSLEQPLEFLTVQIERVALSEHQAQTSATFNGKLKAYQHGIELILQCQPILDLLVEKLKASKAVQGDDSDPVKSHATLPTNENPDQLSDERKQSDDEEKLVLLLHHRLQYLLKSLTKLFLGKQTSLQSKKELEYLANLYKMCYSQSLKCGGHSGLQFVQEINLLIQDIAPKLCEVQEIH